MSKTLTRDEALEMVSELKRVKRERGYDLKWLHDEIERIEPFEGYGAFFSEDEVFELMENW